MKIGDHVKISGTSLSGDVIKIEERREGSSTPKVFYTVWVSDNTIPKEYTRDELRFIRDGL